MKKLFLFLIFGFTLNHAQYLIEDNEISETSKEVSKQNVGYDLNAPLEFYRLKCKNETYAQFPGGENAFQDQLFKTMRLYLDTGMYSVNGTFELNISLDKMGNQNGFTLKPQVTNSNLLFRDLASALRKMNLKFVPATCNGTAVESRIRQKINFRTDNIDL